MYIYLKIAYFGYHYQNHFKLYLPFSLLSFLSFLALHFLLLLGTFSSSLFYKSSRHYHCCVCILLFVFSVYYYWYWFNRTNFFYAYSTIKMIHSFSITVDQLYHHHCHSLTMTILSLVNYSSFPFSQEYYLSSDSQRTLERVIHALSYHFHDFLVCFSCKSLDFFIPNHSSLFLGTTANTVLFDLVYHNLTFEIL